MELSDLRYFVNVAMERSFSRGAARSHVSPPAISKTIAKLEAELEARLFTRTTRHVLLTDAGEVLLRRCRRIFDELDGVRRELDEARHTVAGEVRIGAMEVFSIHLLPSALAGLLRRHPGIVPLSYELVPPAMERLILEGRLDVGFTIGAGEIRGVQRRPLGRSAGVLVCGRGHPLFHARRVVAADLERYPSVIPRILDLPHLPVLDQFPERRFPRAVGATIELLQMGVQLAQEGALLGFFPEVCLRHHLRTRRLRVLPGLRFGVRFELSALTRDAAEPKPAVRLLIEALSSALRPR